MKKTKTTIKSFKFKYGISETTLCTIFDKFGFNKRIKNLKFKKRSIKHISKSLELKPLEKKLFNKKKESITFLKKIKSYKGIRHKLGLPSRGQRTKTNGKTVRKLLKSYRYL